MIITNPNTMTNLIYDVLKTNSNKHLGKMHPTMVMIEVCDKINYGSIDERFIHLYNKALSVLRSQGSIVYGEDGVMMGLSRSALREGF